MYAKALKAKGWREHEIETALRILSRAEAQRPYRVTPLLLLSSILIVFANAGVAFGFSLGILVFSWFWPVLFCIGLCIGIIFEILHCRLEKLRAWHHGTAGVLLAAATFFIFYAVVAFMNRAAVLLNAVPGFRVGPKPALLVAFVYTAAFILPWLLHKIFWKTRPVAE